MNKDTKKSFKVSESGDQERLHGKKESLGRYESKVQQTLLMCGVVSSILYVFVDFLASFIWRGYYDYLSQGFSELLAWGTPTRRFVLILSIVYNCLVIAFGFGIVLSNPRKKSLRITAFLLFGYALVGIVTPAFFPAPFRGVTATLENKLHLPLTSIEVILILASVCFGASSGGKRFGVYSLISLLVLLGFGLWGGSFVSKLEAGQPTPLLGIIERINIYGYLLWVAILSIRLLPSLPLGVVSIELKKRLSNTKYYR